MQLYVFQANRVKLFLSVNGKPSRQKGSTCPSYGQMFNANANSMNSECNDVQYTAEKNRLNRKKYHDKLFLQKQH